MNSITLAKGAVKAVNLTLDKLGQGPGEQLPATIPSLEGGEQEDRSSPVQNMSLEWTYVIHSSNRKLS